MNYMLRYAVNTFVIVVFLVSPLAGHLWAKQKAIKTVAAKSVVVDDSRTLYGMVEARHQATVSAQTSGRVVKIHFDIGDYVKKNDVLIQLRSRNQQQKLDAALARHKRAGADLARANRLYKQGLYSRALLDKAKADYKSAKSALNQAQEEIERTVIRAPYNGIVVKRHIEVGETARVGQPLLSGLSLESLRVSVQIPQDMIGLVRQHRLAHVVINGKSLALSKMSISPYADSLSHSFTAKVSLPKGDFGFYPGMYLPVQFKVGRSQSLLVPTAAVIHRSEVTAVYVVDIKQGLQMRQVRIGRKLASGNTEILAGLVKGEQVALDPARATIIIKSTAQ